MRKPHEGIFFHFRVPRYYLFGQTRRVGSRVGLDEEIVLRSVYIEVFFMLCHMGKGFVYEFWNVFL